MRRLKRKSRLLGAIAQLCVVGRAGSVSGLLSEQFIAVMEPRSQSQTLNIISRCLDAVFVAVSF